MKVMFGVNYDGSKCLTYKTKGVISNNACICQWIFLLHPINFIKLVHVVCLNQPQEFHVQLIGTIENLLALNKTTFNMLCAMQ